MSLSPQDEALFKAFQSNLLSLISHELRTPLMGVLNALSLLEQAETDPGSSIGGISLAEMIQMAQSNAAKLHQNLSSLLDLAALESGTFHTRLREVDLLRLVQTHVESHRKKIRVEWDARSALNATPLLADPQKLGRAIDLCLHALAARANAESFIKVRISSSSVHLHTQLAPQQEIAWDSAWTQSLTGIEGGAASPYSAFGGVMQLEQAFLTRTEEGLGSELLLVHEIMRLHGGKFLAHRQRQELELTLELQELTSETSLQSVLTSRVFRVSTELGSVALILIPIPKDILAETFQNEVRRNLFRTTDGVYSLSNKRELALVLDDCKPEHLTRLMTRLCQSLGRQLEYGYSHCPSDGLDPGTLFGLAQMRLETAQRSSQG